MNLLELILIAFSLSMDTFSLSLGLGAINISKKIKYTYIIVVTIFHFLMPFLGNVLGTALYQIIQVNCNIFLFFIFAFIAFEILLDIKEGKESKSKINMISIIILAFSVSIDSFSVGMALSTITNNYLLSYFLFSFFACVFTIMGFYIGKFSSKILGKYSKILAFIIMIFLAIIHLLG